MSGADGTSSEGGGENSPSACKGATHMFLAGVVTSVGTICDVATVSVCDSGHEACEMLPLCEVSHAREEVPPIGIVRETVLTCSTDGSMTGLGSCGLAAKVP